MRRALTPQCRRRSRCHDCEVVFVNQMIGEQYDRSKRALQTLELAGALLEGFYEHLANPIALG